MAHHPGRGDPRRRGALARKDGPATRMAPPAGERAVAPEDSGGSGPALRGVAPWLVLIVVLIAWEILGIDTGPHQYHLTISALAQAYRPLNAGLLLVWMLVGIGYEAARVRVPIDSNLARPAQTQPHPQSTGPRSPWPLDLWEHITEGRRCCCRRVRLSALSSGSPFPSPPFSSTGPPATRRAAERAPRNSYGSSPPRASRTTC